jgi:hypothetical protein
MVASSLLMVDPPRPFGFDIEIETPIADFEESFLNQLLVL